MKQYFKQIFSLFLVCLLLISSLCLLTACGNEEKNAKLQDLTEQMLNALLHEDEERAYELVKGITTKEAFVEPYQDMCEILTDVRSYTLKQVGWKSSLNNGISAYTVTYQMYTDNNRLYLVDASVADGFEGLYGFHITQEMQNNGASTLDPAAFIPISIVSGIAWMLVVAFCIWMIVDCARRRLNKKALWILLILLSLSINVTLGASGLHFNFMPGIFILWNSLTSDGFNTTVRLTLPVGAIVYFFLRKRITLPPKSEEQSTADSVAPSPAETPAEEQTEHSEDDTQ